LANNYYNMIGLCELTSLNRYCTTGREILEEDSPYDIITVYAISKSVEKDSELPSGSCSLIKAKKKG